MSAVLSLPSKFVEPVEKKNKKVSFSYNKPTCLVADISKLKKTGFKVRKLNLKSFTNYI